MTKPETHDKSRNARLETRVSSDQKDLLQRAASLTGRTLSEFVLDSALQAATKIVQEHEVIRLSRADQVAFATALLNPPKPGKRLQRAVRGYRRLLAPSAIDVVLQGTEWNSAAEIGRRLDAKAANLHAAVSRWQHSGRIFGIDHRGKKIYPAYIFDATWQPLPAVKKILAVLDDYSPFRVAAWFESTNSFLGGRRPREVIASAPQAVVAAAQDHKVGAVHG